MVQSVRRIGYLNYPVLCSACCMNSLSVFKAEWAFFCFFFKVDELHCIICFGNTNMA